MLSSQSTGGIQLLSRDHIVREASTKCGGIQSLPAQKPKRKSTESGTSWRLEPPGHCGGLCHLRGISSSLLLTIMKYYVHNRPVFTTAHGYHCAPTPTMFQETARSKRPLSLRCQQVEKEYIVGSATNPSPPPPPPEI